ncbi:undecaprenyl-phosphate glucose phosphotransferase [Polynucleobacter yangtzensis]|uniref:Undecaprenyl-phosphate glucose phosphotransferase n=1 Tax=Polynucleobacter yangtzensis TaxID=1743159 RepID=A0A9C7CHP1_9BURK|nr:undecaprenyl-phosphate glucose phosphotransferase [Polynucleobacter yangtzensis]BDT76514.1 undecaprenyl-phosphate glucose phosphotransferase [Polynucleobacter yangtzensis]
MAFPKFLPSTIARMVDLLVFVICGFLAFYSYDAYQDAHLDIGRYALLIFLGALTFIFLSNRLYRSWRSEGFFKLIQSIGTVIAKTWILIIFGLFFTKTNDYYSRTWIVAWAIYAFFGLLIARYLMYVVLGRLRILGMNQKHVAIIGSSGTAKELQERIARSPWSGFKVGRFLTNPKQEDLDDLAKESFDEIWLALAMDEQHQIGVLMEGLKNSTANVRLVPDWFSYRLINHGVSEVLGVEMVDLYGTPMTGSNLLVKTIEDIGLSLFIVILLSPVYLVLAIMVKVSSPGPIFYRQPRVGWNGEIFEILKFRTMPVNTEKEGIVWGNSAQKAISPIGRWMRKTSLDELPQFFNVLKGQMSIVGPRPERPEFVEKFKNEIPGYMKKHLVKAGITGWAQIHGWRGDTDLQTRIEYDLFYIDNWSLMLDLKIIFYTPWRGLVNKNAY